MPALDPRLLELLACPSPDHAALTLVGDAADPQALRCTFCGSTYPIEGGIPVLLLDAATPGPRGVGIDQHSGP
jgi:uncharacterized protein YbaR (Trm112 family)